MTAEAPRRILFFLIDGIGDVALPPGAKCAGKTPLQYAKTPTMDALAAAGLNGLLDPVEPGLACGSDTAHMSIFGYPPRKHYRGRGAFESMGAGLAMQPGDIAFKSNFASMDIPARHVINRRADRNFEGLGPVLCEALDGIDLRGYPEHQVAVKYATEHRCGVRVRGPGLSDAITGTDPLVNDRPLRVCEPTDDTAEAAMTSNLINHLSDRFVERLMEHPINGQRIAQGKLPANCILLRGCGSCIDVPSFAQLHGLRAFMIAPTCIIAGLGETIHMDVKKVHGTTGDYHTDLLAKADAAVKWMQSGDYDFGFVHVKAVDDAGHDQDLDKKLHFLQLADEMIASIIRQLRTAAGNAKYTLVLTGDHTTPLGKGDHTYEPVPFTMAHLQDVERVMSSQTASAWDQVNMYDEISAGRGHLGRFCGDQLMDVVKRFSRV
ncbi:hypothetical protein RI367_008686 [Sorochytrium milnesiophthora]